MGLNYEEKWLLRQERAGVHRRKLKHLAGFPAHPLQPLLSSVLSMSFLPSGHGGRGQGVCLRMERTKVHTIAQAEPSEREHVYPSDAFLRIVASRRSCLRRNQLPSKSFSPQRSEAIEISLTEGRGSFDGWIMPRRR